MKSALLLLLPLFFLSGQGCPLGALPNSNHTKCFHLLPTKVDFIVADQTCRLIGGHLVSIGNPSDNNILHGMLHQLRGVDSSVTKAWIGGHNLLTYGDWKWTDGEPFSFAGFDPKKPKILGFNCLSLEAGPWIPTECSEKQVFICATDFIKNTSCAEHIGSR
uniref:C-type lectin domain-containing protein n=1 Tax=Steinernema glaseri TaxID=37863 RepID=A0A1I7YDL8_9BILA